jgi:hypothetical protein
MDLEKEVSYELPEESLLRRYKSYLTLALLMALDRFLQLIVPEALKVIQDFLM